MSTAEDTQRKQHPDDPELDMSRFGRLEGGGNGLSVFTYLTPDPIEDLTDVPGYWNQMAANGGGGFRRFDRIEVTAACESGAPEHGVLIVEQAHARLDNSLNVKVRVLRRY